MLAKPIGAVCNLDCRYCFYTEKRALYPGRKSFRMPDAVLEAYVRQACEGQTGPELAFAWQGGEPTLLGLDFFRRVVDLQRRHAGGRRVRNALQTNGTLLDDAWCAFLTEHDFLVGLSLDGPRALHDAERVDRARRPTFDAVMRGLALLKKHATPFNTLTVVHRRNARQPREVYRFLREVGSGHLQFIPLVERRPAGGKGAGGLRLAPPPVPGGEPGGSAVTDASVEPRAYGEFLVAVFEDWVRRDVGSVFVQLFEIALGSWLGRESALCVFAERCGGGLALEHDGTLYACDHYVYPAYRRGNLLEQPLAELARSPAQEQFGNAKRDALPAYCRACAVRFACHGDCPKHRFARTPDGEPGLSYLCPAYRRFFHHVDPLLRRMADLLRAGRPAGEIMAFVAERDRAAARRAAGRNDPCPCGSGRKFKRCCLARSAPAPGPDA